MRDICVFYHYRFTCYVLAELCRAELAEAERTKRPRHQSRTDCFPLHRANGPSGKSKLSRRNSLMESGPRGPLK